MKRLLAILLLLITALYVLPVADSLGKENKIACKYDDGKMDDSNDESKKENGKEFISGNPAFFTAAATATSPLFINIHKTIVVHHTVETPPPDRA